MKRFFVILLLLLSAAPAFTERRGEIYRLRRNYNFAARKHYPDLVRQLGAAPFVHTLPVQFVIEKPDIARRNSALHDQRLYERILKHALNPPSLAPSEEVLAPAWPLLAWKVARAMEWTHVLHDQLLDILADDRVTDKKSALKEAIDDYLRDPLAITPLPLKVELLSAFPYSHEFHHAYPRVMGIMMSYHWLQGIQYEAMLRHPQDRKEAVEQSLTQFRALLQNPPTHFPLTHKSAPGFYEISPVAGYIFDNLHILHHVAQDILLTEKIKNKRDELYKILPIFLHSSASKEWVAAGPQEEPLMPGALHSPQQHHHGARK